jgi:predicted peptidase
MSRKPLVLFTVVLALSAFVRSAVAQGPPPASAAEPYAKDFEAREFTGADGNVLRYRLLKPLDDGKNAGETGEVDAKKKYPLVLFLHGAGERGDDNLRQLVHGGRNFADEAMRRRYSAFVVAPQCPADKTWAPFRLGGRSDEPQAPLQLSFELLEALQKEFPIDANRIYGMGLSMGGYGTWDILRRKPDLLAAAVPICGGASPDGVAAFHSTPIWVFHGDADPAVSVDLSRNMVKALQEAGGRPIYTEYPGVGHDSWTQTFDNRLMWDWLFAQHKQSP